jgi:hypothetical protein
MAPARAFHFKAPGLKQGSAQAGESSRNCNEMSLTNSLAHPQRKELHASSRKGIFDQSALHRHEITTGRW